MRNHRSPYTKVQRKVLKQIGKDGCAICEYIDGKAYWCSLSGHPYSARTIAALWSKGKLKGNDDALIAGLLPQTLVLT